VHRRIRIDEEKNFLTMPEMAYDSLVAQHTCSTIRTKVSWFVLEDVTDQHQEVLN
jgi:hypothetical protein